MMDLIYVEVYDVNGNCQFMEVTLFGLVPVNWGDMLLDADEYDLCDTRGSCYDLQEVIKQGTAERAAQLAAEEAVKNSTRDFSAMMGEEVRKETRNFSAMMGQGAGVSNDGASFEQTFPGMKPTVCEYECFEGEVWREMPRKPKKCGGFWPSGCAVKRCMFIHKTDPAASWVVVDETSLPGYRIARPQSPQE